MAQTRTDNPNTSTSEQSGTSQLCGIAGRQHPGANSGVHSGANWQHSLLAVMALAPMLAQAQTSSQLPEVKVKAAVDVPFKANASASPKLAQPLLDTPQTISVIKKELMQEQGVASVMEALRNTPGITLQLGENGNTSVGDTFQMRGFASETSMFVDGIRDLGGVTRDTFNIEQLEVVKGPAGADVGRGAASGYINLMSKLPQADQFQIGGLSLNDASNKRLTADINQPLGKDMAVRLNLLVQEGGVSGRDLVNNKGIGFAPALAFGLGQNTRFYLYSQHMRQENRPDGGVPTIGLPGFYNADARLRSAAAVDPSNYYGSVHDEEKVTTDMLTAKFEHEFGQKNILRNITRTGRAHTERVLTGVNALSAAANASADKWTVARTRQGLDRTNRIFANQTSINSEFATGSVQHSLVAGLELSVEKQDLPSFAVPTGITIPAANLYAPQADVVLPQPRRNGAYSNGSTRTAALYAFDTLTLNKEWQINAGLRLEKYRTSTDSATLSTAAANPGLPVGTPMPVALNKSGSLVNWKAGLVYKPVSNGSVYAAIASSSTPPGAANFALSATANNINSPALDPQKTANMEMGTKWELLNKKLSLSAALYRTEHKNEIVQLDAATNTYAQFGKRRVQGLELGVVGQLSSAWQLSAGLATMSAKVLQGSTGNNAAGAASRWSPKLTATLWTSYKINPAWTVGGGARYVSVQKRVVDPAQNPALQNMPEIPSYWVADALLSYQLHKNLALQLNLYNLFDKAYVANLNNSGARYTPGTPRSAMLTANLQF